MVSERRTDLIEQAQKHERWCRVRGAHYLDGDATVPVQRSCLRDIAITLRGFLAYMEADDARTPVPAKLYERIKARASGENPVNEDWELLYEVLPHLRPANSDEELLTREKWAEEFVAAVDAAAECWGVRRDEIHLNYWSTFEGEERATVAIIDGQHIYGRSWTGDPIAALRALADAAPCPHEGAEDRMMWACDAKQSALRDLLTYVEAMMMSGEIQIQRGIQPLTEAVKELTEALEALLREMQEAQGGDDDE